jgi:hypothetical protein
MINQGTRDNWPSLIAIGLLAYASADIAHHVLGHGGACLALGGRVVSASSIFVDCTAHTYPTDMAGPFANLVVGFLALLGNHVVRRPDLKLFLGLAAGFNLLWFALQFFFSVATRTDDFAWLTFLVAAPWRYGLAALGLVAYLFFIRLTARSLASFAQPPERLRVIVRTVWLTGGIFACITALRDHHPLTAILHHAAPQSFLLSIGLLLLPRHAAGAVVSAPPVALSWFWIGAALAVAFLSILFLGPGFAFP